MTLVDAGPLVAMFGRGEKRRWECVRMMTDIAPPLLTTWPVIAEAMHIVGAQRGWYGQNLIWQLILGNHLLIANLEVETIDRAQTLMGKYRDLPMDLADATLVALAEKVDCKTVFTLDSDFRIYKFKNRAAFNIIPH